MEQLRFATRISLQNGRLFFFWGDGSLDPLIGDLGEAARKMVYFVEQHDGSAVGNRSFTEARQ